jgi:endo-beta-N-acetylglucosaminidase D
MKETGHYYGFEMWMAQETEHVAGDKRSEASEMRFLIQLARISVRDGILQNLEVGDIR